MGDVMVNPRNTFNLNVSTLVIRTHITCIKTRIKRLLWLKKTVNLNQNKLTFLYITW